MGSEPGAHSDIFSHLPSADLDRWQRERPQGPKKSFAYVAVG